MIFFTSRLSASVPQGLVVEHTVAEALKMGVTDLQVGKVNVDEEMSLAQQFGVTSIPMLLLFKDGKPVAKSVGYRPKAELEALLEQ